MKLASNMIWHMEVLRIWLEEQPLIKYYMLKHLLLLKIRNMMDINVDLLQWFINFWRKSHMPVLLKIELYRAKN